ncbi:MAG: M48 family metalloprotease [Pseudomonadota bacterium]
MSGLSVVTPKRRSRLRSLCYGALAALSTIGLSLPTAAPASAQTVLRDAEIEQWLWDHSYEIFEAAKLDPNSIEFLIIGDPSVNAFASGRTMGMFTGTITTAGTPNEIEGVIAHEAGHMAGGHGPRRADAYAKASRPILLSLVLAAGAIAAGAPEAGIGLLGLGQQIGTVNALAYTRGQEASADQAAVSYMNAVGRSSAGLVSFFAKLRNSQVITARKINPYFQTHPLANARLTALEKRVNESPYVNMKDSEEEILRLQMIQAKIKGFLQAPKFTLREYPTSDLSDPGRYARAVAFYRGTDLERALREINALLEKYPDNPYFHELKGQMLFEFSRVADSVEPHRRSVELAPTKALLRVNLGRALLATETTENLEESVTVLKSALQLEPENGFGWHELARAYGSLGNEPMALLATAESHYHAGSAQSVQFAQRALRGLDRGTPEWQQARDIIVAVTNALDRRGRGKRRGRPQPAPEAPKPDQDKDKDKDDDAPIEILIPGESPDKPGKDSDDAPIELPEAPVKKG